MTMAIPDDVRLATFTVAKQRSSRSATENVEKSAVEGRGPQK